MNPEQPNGVPTQPVQPTQPEQVNAAYQQQYQVQQPPAHQATQSAQQQSAQQPAQTFAQAPASLSDLGKQHVHHSYIWLGSLRAIGVLIVVLIIGSISSIISVVEALAEYGTGAIMLPIIIGAGVLLVLVCFGIFAGFTALAFKNLFYEVGSNEFSLYSGIISKKKVHVPYQRIQSVDQRASLLQRLFGVCNVFIDTAGGAANKAILVPYLTKQQAQALKTELYTRKALLQGQSMQAASTASAPITTATQPAATAAGAQPSAAQPAATAAGAQPAASVQPVATMQQPQAAQGGNVLDSGEQIWNHIGGVFAGEDAFLEPVSYEYGLSNKELIFTGLSNNSSFFLAIVIVIGFLAQAFTTIFDIFPESEDAVFEGIAASALDYGVTQVSLTLIFGLIVIAFIVWIASTLGACLQYGGFHARRRGERIEVERGLLQHQSKSVSIDRVQSVIVKQTFIRRILGYCELSLGRIDAAEESNGSEQSTKIADQGLVIHPFVKKSRVPEILAGLVPEFSDAPSDADMRSVSKKALRRGLIRRCIWQGGGFWLAVFVAICQIVLGAIEPYMDYDSIMFLLAILPFFAILYLLAAVIFVIDIVGTVFWSRESGFAYNRRFMTVHNGGLSTASVSFPRNKIQFGFTRTNPLQRVAGTATILAVTAAGIGGTTTQLIDVEEQAATDWLKWLEPFGS